MPGIVVGTDGSAHSQRALEWAVGEAALRHVPLTVITVPELPAG
jgi:nucleotide-binding universal stress UspA family protein